ncbi:hypothetical protein [Belnapia sp. F-4-1]|uniref:hypothetical protein n=1 Tax=Belnapia sp. F-4-1 TaxID=1545443 RepID=UPI0005BE3EC3|nr:hypothetical protein [Belnapia sp. F-4-1]
MEERMGMGKQPKIFVYRGLDETEEEAFARHFEGKGPPPGAELIIFSLGPMLPREPAEGAK